MKSNNLSFFKIMIEPKYKKYFIIIFVHLKHPINIRKYANLIFIDIIIMQIS